MTSEQDLYQQASAFIQAGETDKARELLTHLLQMDRKNVDYWLWMSAVVKTTKERVYCLREVLAIDPGNEDAALGLRMAGEKAPEGNPSQWIPQQDIPWKTSLEIADEHPLTHKAARPRVVLYTLLGIVVLGLFLFGILQALKPAKPVENVPIKRWTITPLPTATETATPQPSSTGYAPLVINQALTFTPTPLYVATPHNRLEAYDAAMRAYDKGNWAEAVDYFKQVLADEPNSPDIYYHLGDVYRFQGKYKDASSAYQSAIKLNPNFAPAYLGKGRVLLESSPSNPEGAINNFELAIEKDPHLVETYLEMAKANLAMSDANMALSWLDKYLQYAPENAASTLYRAQAYLILGKDDQALAEIEKSRQMDSTSIETYKTWGQVLQALDNYKDSIPVLLTVLQYDPLDLDSEAWLARAYYETGDAQAAFGLIDTVLQQDNKDTDAYLLRADIYLDQGNLESAKTDYNAVLRIDYNNFDANVGLGRVFLAQSYAGAAYNQFDYAVKLAVTDAQKASIIYWKAKALQGINEISAAITQFNAALDYPNNALPNDLREDAEKQLALLYTPTPTSSPTATLRVTATPTATTAQPSPLPTITSTQ